MKSGVTLAALLAFFIALGIPTDVEAQGPIGFPRMLPAAVWMIQLHGMNDGRIQVDAEIDPRLNPTTLEKLLALGRAWTRLNGECFNVRRPELRMMTQEPNPTYFSWPSRIEVKGKKSTIIGFGTEADDCNQAVKIERVGGEVVDGMNIW